MKKLFWKIYYVGLPMIIGIRVKTQTRAVVYNVLTVIATATAIALLVLRCKG